MATTDQVTYGLEPRRVHPRTGIIRTRLVLAALLLGLALGGLLSRGLEIAFLAGSYFVATIVVSCLPSRLLDQKRVRGTVILMDLAAISLMVTFTGGAASSWYLLFFFPVLSAARYLGQLWSLAVAVVAAAAYALSISSLGVGFNGADYGLQAAVLVAVALTASNLARQRGRAEVQLMRGIEEIQRHILTNQPIHQVLRTITRTALRTTRSDGSAILLLDGRTVIAFERASAESLALAVHVEELLRGHLARIIDSQYPLSLPEGRGLAALLPLPTRDKSLWPARLVALRVDDHAIGVLGVVSSRRLHYTADDVRRLTQMAPLIAVAQSYALLQAEAESRLTLLFEIGEKLKTEQGLKALVVNVVELTAGHLRSEEAALFIADGTKAQLVKAAVAGPDDGTTARLARIETAHSFGKGVAGDVFNTLRAHLSNDASADFGDTPELAASLPSKRTLHHLAVPLVIGGEPLGVIRVVNKKGAGYCPMTPELAVAGFTAADQRLLGAIAIQIASAIRNAMFVERRRRLEYVVRNSPTPIIVVDRRGTIQEFNKACGQLWGMPPEEAIGDRVHHYYESAEHARDIRAKIEAAEDHTIHDFEARIRNRHGDVIPIRLAAAFLYEEGQVVGSIGVFSDDRWMIEEKLAALGRVAHNTAHDVKTDLATIDNWIDVLEGLGADEAHAEACGGIRAATTAALGKIQNMLMTAPPPEAPEVERISLRSLVEDFHHCVSDQARAIGLDFHLRAPDADLPVLANSEELRQVLTNLFANSREAILSRTSERRPAGCIELELDAAADTVFMTWRDNGPGMSPDLAGKAFGAFYTTKEYGSGLGLYISKKLLSRHRGTICFEPNDGGGALFRITLPLAPAPSPSPSSDERRPIADGQAARGA